MRLTREILVGLSAAPARTVLTVFATLLGVGTLVAVIGIGRTAQAQIELRLASLAATQISIYPAKAQSEVTLPLPWTPPVGLLDLPGVVGAGNLSPVAFSEDGRAQGTPVLGLNRSSQVPLTVYGATPGIFDVVAAAPRSGVLFTGWHEAMASRVIVLGRGAASRLGVLEADGTNSILLGDEIFIVLGVLDGAENEPALLDAGIIPQGTARQRFHLDQPARLLVAIDPGWVPSVGRAAPYALSGSDPGSFLVVVPSDNTNTRVSISGDVEQLLFAVGGLFLVAGFFAMSNTMLVSVLARTAEIGLRRALGAARSHILIQFLGEAAILGTVGGLAGAGFGLGAVLAWSHIVGLVAQVDATLVVFGPPLGLGTGLVAGLYPAFRAIQLDPVDAIRAGMEL